MDIYSVLSSKPHNPHYLNRYITFINRCQSNISAARELCVEKHHICPKAKDMFPEYRKFTHHPWNLAILTPRQHFIAHMILWKTFPSIKSQSEALWHMKHINDASVDSKVYQRLKETKKATTSSRHKGKIVSKEAREKMSRFRKGRSYDEIMGCELASLVKIRFSEQRKGTMVGEANHMYGKVGPLHHNYGKVYNAGASNPMYGKPRSLETRKKISETRKRINEGKKTVLPPDQIIDIVSMYISTLDLKGTAARFDVSQADVLRLLKDSGYYPSGRKMSEFRAK